MSDFEINFVVHESLYGGFEAKAVDYSIYTQCETVDEVKSAIKDAVHCHFDEDKMPKTIYIGYFTNTNIS